MKYKFFSIFVILAMLMVVIGPSAAFADAYEADWITSITYQNIGSSATTTLNILFYDSPSDTSPLTIPRDNLAAGAGTSVYVGGIGGIDPGFQGTAVMAADQPLAATLVQIAKNPADGTKHPTVKVRPLSNGFTSGASTSQIATVLKNTYSSNSIFAVQNAGSVDTTVTIKFIDTAAVVQDTLTQSLKPGAGYHVDAGSLGTLPASFNGSVVITTSPSTPIVSSAMELQYGSAKIKAKAFEGVSQGAQTYYMPSALCKATQVTNYAVQNTNLATNTSVTVTYSNGSTDTSTVLKGAKVSFNTCNAAGIPSNFSGSATITSTATDIIAMGKVGGSGGLSTAFIGFPSGPSKVALPYIRWGNDTNWYSGKMQRANIAIQNVGAADIPAGTITIKYIDRDGNVVGTTHTISGILEVGKKANSNPTNAGLTQFGCYNGCTQFGGGAVIEGPTGCQLAVVARVTAYNGGLRAGEDYNGIPMP